MALCQGQRGNAQCIGFEAIRYASSQSGADCLSSRETCMFVSFSSVCVSVSPLSGVCSRLLGGSFSPVLSGLGVFVRMLFGCGFPAVIHGDRVDHGMFAPSVSYYLFSGVVRVVNGRVVVGLSVAPRRQSNYSFGWIIARRRFINDDVGPAQFFNDLTRSNFGSIGLYSAVGQLGLVIGPRCNGIVSRTRVMRRSLRSLLPGPHSPRRIDGSGGIDASPGAPVAFGSSDWPVVALEALLAPDDLVSLGPFGAVGSSQFITNEASGVADEHGIVDVGVCDAGADVDGDAYSGAVIDSCCSDTCGDDVGAVGGLIELDRSVGSGDMFGAIRAFSFGAMSAPSFGAMSAPSCPPTDQHPTEEGEYVDSAGVFNWDGRVRGVGGWCIFGT